ncbi:hypothetical protein [Mycolicibacterium sediminis]|uniref:Uncharacterized protein n=1 Tax=Mycolicibacterium sediminis TaxID=1286180 RepID=A0A7I7QM84_9MYCO|nr:hypothetical protein [Mycolicibacterium sediminis]BBY27107.1 hypothetical protein MSEDJ_12030 [Mycolicibacterium sediminis]
MAIRDWSRAKITFLIGLPVFLVIAVPMVVLAYRSEPPRVSGDCVHVDQALRHWMAVLPRIQLGMAEAGDTNLLPDVVAAARSVRGEAEAIQDPALRSTVTTLADDLDRVSSGSSSSPPKSFPDQDFVGGLQNSMSTGHALKLACPAAVNDPLPTQ